MSDHKALCDTGMSSICKVLQLDVLFNDLIVIESPIKHGLGPDIWIFVCRCQNDNMSNPNAIIFIVIKSLLSIWRVPGFWGLESA
jgi:hypothetical protein